MPIAPFQGQCSPAGAALPGGTERRKVRVGAATELSIAGVL